MWERGRQTSYRTSAKDVILCLWWLTEWHLFNHFANRDLNAMTHCGERQVIRLCSKRLFDLLTDDILGQKRIGHEGRYQRR